VFYIYVDSVGERGQDRGLDRAQYSEKVEEDESVDKPWLMTYNGLEIEMSRYACLYQLFDSASLCNNAQLRYEHIYTYMHTYIYV
jgi:hypothetical protein